MADKEVFVTIITRGGTTEEWESANPTPKDREFCVEATTDGKRKFKIGDGLTAWNDLPYATSGELADLTQDSTHRTVTDAEKATWNAKQNALTFDTTPTANSSNPVTSGGVKTALDAKAAKSEIVKPRQGLPIVPTLCVIATRSRSTAAECLNQGGGGQWQTRP